jgi:toxin HigB-1
MILNFKSKSLEKFAIKGDVSSINHSHIKKLKKLLSRLNSATNLNDLSFPGSGFHPLKGDLKGHFALSVSGNWRLVFRFDNGDVLDLDYIDYH